MPVALLALTAGAFGIGTTEFVIMGLLMQVAGDFHVSLAAAGLLISAYALGVALGAPLLTLATRRLPRKHVLLALMAIFTLGNVACALSPSYSLLLGARVLTSLAHGTFFGVGSVVATGLVPPERRASAIASMFTGLTAATLLGVPAGAWLGLQLGWRSTFWAVAGIGVIAWAVLWSFVPRAAASAGTTSLRAELEVLTRPQVWIGLAMTVLGFAGVFTVFTYVQPLLTRVAGLSRAAVSPALLLFGAGLALGNVLGGKLADRAPMRAVLGTLIVLAVVLFATHWLVVWSVSALIYVAVLGVAAFATVAPLQLRVLEKAKGPGESLASSLNIAAFNLGNALGAWVGGVVVDRGPGLGGLGFAACALTSVGLVLALLARRLERRVPLSRACGASA